MSEPDQVGEITEATFEESLGVIRYTFEIGGIEATATLSRKIRPSTILTDEAMRDLAEELPGKKVRGSSQHIEALARGAHREHSIGFGGDLDE